MAAVAFLRARFAELGMSDKMKAPLSTIERGVGGPTTTAAKAPVSEERRADCGFGERPLTSRMPSSAPARYVVRNDVTLLMSPEDAVERDLDDLTVIPASRSREMKLRSREAIDLAVSDAAMHGISAPPKWTES